jgi:hypothetical protein
VVVAGTWYGGTNAWNIGANITLDLPIGCWDLEYYATLYVGVAGGTTDIEITLSSNPAAEDADYTYRIYSSTVQNMMTSMHKRHVRTVTTKTTYYLMGKSYTANNTVYIYNTGANEGYGFVIARCLYL